MNLTSANTAIVLDSTADLPDAATRFPNWRVVPLYVNFGTESYRDGVDLTAEQFYARLPTANPLPTTSQPTPADFEAVYDELAAYERIFSIHIAARLSGTFQSAGLAADERVRTIDSETASAAITMLALAIQRRLDRGTTDEEVDALVERYRSAHGLLFTVDTLEFLARGGRIGRAKAFAGELLNVKPILSIRDAEVVPVKRVRGGRKAFQEFVDAVETETTDSATLRFGRAHAEAPERAAELAKMVRDLRPDATIEVETVLGAVIGAHAGPGTVGLFWFDDADPSGPSSSVPSALAPSTMTEIRRQTAFAGLDRPQAWPATRGRPRPERLDAALDTLDGVGVTVKRRLAKLGLETIRDLLEHAPRRYETAADEVSIAELHGDDEVVIVGDVLNVSKRPLRGRRTLVSARISDGTATISAAWFNQPWIADQLKPGTRVRLRGKNGRYGFDVKSYDLGGARNTADFAPVYPAAEEIPAKTIRRIVDAALPYVSDFVDPLPAELRECEALPLKRDALAALHRPRTEDEAEIGRRRLAFDELLLLQIAIARRAAQREKTLAPSLGEAGDLILRYRRKLPFALTPYQEQAIREIDEDLARTVPMHRLLQGDVGSGKTVVALYALLRAVENGRQGVLMAPTETLAEQHFLTVADLCAELGVSCGLLTNSTPKRDRAAALGADVVVGTHALIQEGVELRDLAVAVVDEQHRFGVAQREALADGRGPHVLHMTATPIPRTLALTVYGDLAVSEIAKPPASRKPVVTSRIGEERASEAYVRLARLLREGRQAYVVCPLIEESETSRARAAEAEAERLQRAELRDFQVGCVHGRLKAAERRDLMARFKAGELDVLVATTVIEVGVDVPNATVMIVQEADRFGLAQLHQLRGRVGRGAEQSYCLLVSRSEAELTESAQRRLDALVATSDGFALAEVDLDLRQSGQLLGVRQSGATDLRFADFRRDRPLLERARATARRGTALPELPG